VPSKEASVGVGHRHHAWANSSFVVFLRRHVPRIEPDPFITRRLIEGALERWVSIARAHISMSPEETFKFCDRLTERTTSCS
jgi:hypothetical protein